MSRRSFAVLAFCFTTKTQPTRSPPRSAIQQYSRFGSNFSMKSLTIPATSASKGAPQPSCS